jgi:hypothetical protein
MSLEWKRVGQTDQHQWEAEADGSKYKVWREPGTENDCRVTVTVNGIETPGTPALNEREAKSAAEQHFQNH